MTVRQDLKKARDEYNIASHLLIAELIANRLYKDADEVQDWQYVVTDIVMSAKNFYFKGKLDFYAKFELDVPNICDCGRVVV